MRSFEQRRAEVFRRSECIIKKRKAVIRSLSLCAMTLVMFVTLSVGYLNIEKMSSEEKDKGYNSPSLGGVNDGLKDPNTPSTGNQGEMVSGSVASLPTHFFGVIRDIESSSDEAKELKKLFFEDGTSVIIANDVARLSKITDITNYAFDPEKYGEQFFEDKSLVIVYFVSPSLTNEYRLSTFSVNDGTLTINIDLVGKHGLVCAIRSWIMVAEVSAEYIAEIESIKLGGNG